jgi:hypothetical protein
MARWYEGFDSYAGSHARAEVVTTSESWIWGGEDAGSKENFKARLTASVWRSSGVPLTRAEVLIRDLLRARALD